MAVIIVTVEIYLPKLIGNFTVVCWPWNGSEAAGYCFDTRLTAFHM